jgi:Kef-type K+ transport system membrane component KefB
VSLPAATLLRFLLEVVLLLGAARLLGEGARRLGQPEVLGELLAGVLLGPSLLGAVAPGAEAFLFPTSGAAPELLAVVAEFGVLLLLLLSGAEVDLELVARWARPATLVALVGAAVPFALGYGLAHTLPPTLAGPAATPGVFALFLATALALSAIPVIVKILLDMGLLRRDVGQLALAAGVLSDTLGWFLLAVVAGLAAAHGIPLRRLGFSLAGTGAFAALCFAWGPRACRALLAWVDDHLGGPEAPTTAVLLLGLAGAAVTQALHLEAFLGAFLVGIQLARVPRARAVLADRLGSLTVAVFAPLFFATAGLRVDAAALARPTLLGITLLLVVVASVGKFLGAYGGARLAGLGAPMATALGVGLNARGAVEIVVASVGLSLGVLAAPAYAMVVVVAVATSVLTPPLLRAALRRLPRDETEERRLAREAFAAQSYLHRLGRLLVPVRDGRYALAAADVVAHLCAGREVEAVALHVAAEPAEPPAWLAARLGTSAGLRWTFRTVPPGDGVPQAILAEAARGYDLLVLGAPDGPVARGTFGPLVDHVVARAPCAVLVLRARPWRSGTADLARIVVPTKGTAAERRAAELALAIARGTGARVVALAVVEPSPLGWAGQGGDAHLEAAAWAAARELVALGREGFDVVVEPEVRWATQHPVAWEIAQAAARPDDLLLLTAERRSSGGELYAGRTVSQVVRLARGPLAVLFPPANG